MTNEWELNEMNEKECIEACAMRRRLGRCDEKT